MLGSIAGDIAGSRYEFKNIKTKDFTLFSGPCRFTDDTVLTVALADSLMHNKSYSENLRRYAKLYPNSGYGGRFKQWTFIGNTEPYNSYGNGSAMRVSPVAWLFNDLKTVLQKAKESAEVTHNHPEGIKGAQATAAAIYLARTNTSKSDIKEYISHTFGYNLDFDYNQLVAHNVFDETCQGSVPQAIFSFLISTSFEDCLKTAISIGGDSDTIACIAGGIAEAFYGLPENVKEIVMG